jgi:glycosyltransferase involved in cell wall biosynthesis
MKIVLLNTYSTGGAARASYRLFQGLKSADADISMMVRGDTNLPDVISAGSLWSGYLRALLEACPLHLYPGRQLHNFSPSWVSGRGVNEVNRLTPDIVHLHWIAHGFIQIDSMTSIVCPIVWTMHDSWAFTGGCHLPGECLGYERECGHCPVLGSHQENDLSRRIWRQKQIAYKNLPLTLVAPSRWLADKARASSLFRDKSIVVIPNGIDTVRYSPGDRLAARRQLGLPENRYILLYGAHHAISDKNKGLDLLLAALRLIDDKLLQGTELVLFGEDTDEILQGCSVNVKNFGTISDEDRLVLLYRAADVFVAPSRQENLPNMVMEAMSCGTPCVAFSVGGIPELIEHGDTGYLAKPYEIGDLAQGLSQLLLNRDRREFMSEQSRKWIENNVSMAKVVALYQVLYRAATSI